MLKRKLVKAGFFGHGALFIMVSPYGTSLKAEHQPAPLQETTIPVQKDLLTQALEDTGILQVTDTLLAFSGNSVDSSEIAVEAPKISLNASAAKYVKYFLKKNDGDLRSIERRSEPYFSIIEPILAKHGLPLELKYLAVIESELRASAVSRVGARGPWQLMASTARELGLKITKKYDERSHYTKSTTAAAKHLKGLYREFGDWLLVIAAYNAGSGTVQHAIRKSGTRNFWLMQQYLPAETRGHVKKFIGTHCYFQEEPSLTMLTKAETLEYKKALEAFKVRQTAPSDSTNYSISSVR